MMTPFWEFRLQIVLGCLLFLVAGFAVRAGGIRAGVAFLAAWLFPGAGHVVAGKWKKGLFCFCLLGLLYAIGMWITGFHAVTFEDNQFYYFGKYGSGITLLLAQAGSAEKAVPRLDLHPSWFDPGLLYVCVTGLLNLVLMLNVLELKPATSSAPREAGVPEGNPSSMPPESATPTGKPSSALPGPAVPEGRPDPDLAPPPAPAAPEAAA